MLKIYGKNISELNDWRLHATVYARVEKIFFSRAGGKIRQKTQQLNPKNDSKNIKGTLSLPSASKKAGNVQFWRRES